MQFTKLATLTHLNLRAEGKDDKALVADVKFATTLQADDLIEFHPNLVGMLWDSTGYPRFRSIIEAVKLKSELLHHDVKAQNIPVRDARLHKFHVEPLPMHSAAVEFTATFYPGGQVVAMLSEFIAQQVELEVSAMADLFNMPEGTSKDVKLTNGETVTVTRRPGVISPSAAAPPKPEKKKQPAGSRRDRVPPAEPASAAD